jgi:hypothetical protein
MEVALLILNASLARHVRLVSVATMESKAAGCDKSYESGVNSKPTNNKVMEQANLRACRTPARLDFAAHNELPPNRQLR